jgi:sterol desaturase/sphingolipid hydroxylase (fatty acid hydroxylase superfamily)
MQQTVGGVVGALLLLSALLVPLERLFPAIAGRSWLRRGLPTDLFYWFLTPLLTKAVTRGALIAAVLLLALAAGVPLDGSHLRAFVDPPGSLVRRQPAWLQVFEVLLIGDFIGYWVHRAFHRDVLWPFHAVHHSSIDLDWLSAVRLHPLNDVLARVAQAIPILLLGFPPMILAGYVPFLAFYAIFLHANVPWTFGPLRHLIASPTFHRWHHTSEEEGLDRNFAGLFPLWDLLFGTFYLPEGRQPSRFGLRDGQAEEGLVAQLFGPFRRPAAVRADGVPRVRLPARPAAVRRPRAEDGPAPLLRPRPTPPRAALRGLRSAS